MHFQTSGYLPALRDLTYPTGLWVAWRSMDPLIGSALLRHEIDRGFTGRFLSRPRDRS